MYDPQNSFYESNHEKVVFYMKLSLTIFLCLAAILVSVCNISRAFSLYTVVTILVLFLIVSDAVLFTMYKKVTDRNKKRNEIFNSELFHPFRKRTIDNQLIYTQNKWQFTEETLMASIDSFNVICNPSTRNKNAIDFNFQAQIKLKRDNVENVISFFRENGVDIYAKNRINGVKKTIEINNKTSTELYDDILKTVELLKNNDFKSFDDWEDLNTDVIIIE
jgi:hypothetical protein